MVTEVCAVEVSHGVEHQRERHAQARGDHGHGVGADRLAEEGAAGLGENRDRAFVIRDVEVARRVELEIGRLA